MRTDNFKHTWYEDVFGIATGSILLGLGISLLKSGEILTGGTVGLALLFTQYFSESVSVLYVLISIPFFFLAIWQKGLNFAIRSFLNILLVSYLVSLVPNFLTFKVESKLVVSILANAILGMGVLAIFRHNSSLGGFNIIALIFQDKLKIQAGYVQVVLDSLVLIAGLSVFGLSTTLASLVGVIVLNGILALNHRSDRYVGHSKSKT